MSDRGGSYATVGIPVRLEYQFEPSGRRPTFGLRIGSRPELITAVLCVQHGGACAVRTADTGLAVAFLGEAGLTLRVGMFQMVLSAHGGPVLGIGERRERPINGFYRGLLLSLGVRF